MIQLMLPGFDRFIIGDRVCRVQRWEHHGVTETQFEYGHVISMPLTRHGSYLVRRDDWIVVGWFSEEMQRRT